MLKRLMSLLVAVTMLVSLFSATAVAQETVPQNDTEVVVPAAEPEAPKEEPQENKGDTSGGAEDAPTSDTPVEDDTTIVNEPPAPTEEKGEDDADDPAPADGEQEELIDQPPTDEAIVEQIAAATAALAALPDAITWDAFAAVEAAGAALAAVPADLQAQVEGAGKLQPAIDALLAIYADALAALDSTADVWENQHAIKAFAEMKVQMDAALYVKPADDMSLMGDEAADLSWLDAALLAYADAEACIIPAGGDMSLMATHAATDYDKLQKAINAATNGDTVLVKNNLKIEQTISAENGATYTINTNKKKIELGSAQQLQFKAGTVTINGGGTIDGTATSTPTIYIPRENTPALTLDNITVLTNAENSDSSSAIFVAGGKSLTVQNCTFDGTTAIFLNDVSSLDTLIVKDSSITAFGSDEHRDAAIRLLCDAASLTVQIDNVDIDTNCPRAIYFTARNNSDTNATIQNCNLKTTHSTNSPVCVYKEADGNIDITISNTQTYPAFADENCTLADGQFNFLNNATGGSIIASMDDAFAITDSITLTSNYTAEAPIVIPQGKTLDTGEYVLGSDYGITVEGTLVFKSEDTFLSATTITDTGTVRHTTHTFPDIAPKASDNATVKPWFGLHKGAVMGMKKSTAGVLKYTALKGDITIQHGRYDEVNTFFLEESETLHIVKGKATVWVANDITLRNQDRVTGDSIHIIYATNANGTKQYEDIMEAIANETTVKLVRNNTLVLDANASTIVIDKSMTFDLNGFIFYIDEKRPDDDVTSLFVGASKKINVTFKNGEVRFTDYTQADNNFVGMRVGNLATVTLDGVDALSLGSRSMEGSMVCVEDGGTVTGINKSRIRSDYHTLADIQPGGTLKMEKSSTLYSNNSRLVIVHGEQDKQATVELTGVDVDTPFLVGKYVNLTMTNCTVNHTSDALPLLDYDDSNEGSEITITGGKLKTTKNDVINLSGIKRLTITGTKIDSSANGIVLNSGDITLNNVTLSAGEAALSVIAGSSEGDSINLTITGGSYTTTGATAFVYGHTNGAEARTLTIKSEGAEFWGSNASIAYSGSGTAPKVQTSDLAAYPALANTSLLSTDSTIFTAALDETAVTIVAKTLTEAFAMNKNVAITLQEDYKNTKEDLPIGRNNALDVNGHKLTVGSITSYGEITALTTSSITASKFVQYGRYDDTSLIMRLQSAATLAGNTVLELVPLQPDGCFDHCGLIINDLSSADTNGRVVAYVQEEWYDSLLLLTYDDYAEINVRAIWNDGVASAEITVVKGRACINGDTKKYLDDGNNQLILKPGTLVYMDDTSLLTSTKNIRGDLYLPSLAAFIDAVAALPDNPEDITYKHYDLVREARNAYDFMDDEGSQNMSAAKEPLEKYNQIMNVYLDAYIQTAPVEILFTLDAGGTIEPGGTASVPTHRNATGIPSYVNDRLNDSTKYDWVVELSDNEKFKLENGTITALSGANSGDSVTITVYAQGKETLSAYQSASASTTLLVAPAKNNATLTEVVLESYTYTVNKSGATKDISIPVKYVYSNGMTYGADGHIIGEDLALEDEGTNYLSTMYTISFDAENDCIVLTLKEGATLAKNKTYTGRINFGAIQKDNANCPVPNSHLVSVKVTEVAPKVTVKVANADLVNATVRSNEACTIVYENAVTLSGANKDDVESIVFEKFGDVTFTYVKSSNTLTITSPTPLTKGKTLKPIANITYTTASGFAPTAQTVSIKITETTPAVKLIKTSATISGKTGDVVTVQLVATNKKTPFNLNLVNGVDVLKTVGKEYVATNVATATYTCNRQSNTGTITITLQKDVEKSEKLTLRLLHKTTVGNKYLPFTLNVKPLSAKLQKSSVTFNVKSTTRTAEIGITVTPESAGVTLTKVGDTAAANGVATVDGIKFTCLKGKAITVDVSAATLVKGTKKYSLTFDGIAKPLTLSVKVEDKYQTVKLQKSSVTLNTALVDSDGSPNDYAEVQLLYSDGILNSDMVEIETSHGAVCAEYDDNYNINGTVYGVLHVEMYAAAPKTATVTLHIKNGAKIDPKKSTLKLTVKKNEKPLTLKASVSGKLDPLNPNSTVTAKLSLSGTAECINTKTVFKEVGDKYYLDLTNQSILVIKDYKPETAQLILGWANGANTRYGTGKHNLNAILYDGNLGAVIATLPNATTVTAEAPKLKLAAQTATLYQSLPYEYAKLAITTGNTQTDKLINNVWLAKQSEYYTVERTADGFGIRYKGGKADFGSKWKATDSIQLNVTYVGSSKVYAVKVPILNVQTQPTAQ